MKSGEILSYTDKYMGGTKGSKGMQAAQKRIPADLPEDMTAHIRNLAGETFRVLSCHGVSRVDLIADKSTGEVFVNEITRITLFLFMGGYRTQFLRTHGPTCRSCVEAAPSGR